MLPEQHICERARLARDPRFDGAFFIGVLTTGIYCRPICAVRQPAAHNVRFYASAAAAEDAGYRACGCCRPERASRVPEVLLADRTVVRALRLIDGGYPVGRDSGALAAALGLTRRHLHRLFRQELGTTPMGMARSRRRALAKRLIDDCGLPFASVAMQAGYGSRRRFNEEMERVFGCSPRTLRGVGRGGRGGPGATGGLSLYLPVREPYDAGWVFGFLERRALAGFEQVDGMRYRRRVLGGGGAESWVEVSWTGDALRLEVPEGCPAALSELLPRVRRVFDLDAEPSTVAEDLSRDPLLAPLVAAYPGLRVPGAWDGFETAVRAVLGQQVSVDRATVLARGLLERFGEDSLSNPERLARADVAAVGMPGRRGEAIRRLAAVVADGALELHEGADAVALQQALCALPGIGPWTAGYVAMRVAKDPDAYPANDWVVLKMLEAAVPAGEARAAAAGRCGSRADAWRPWRAHAVMYLWKWSKGRLQGRKRPA